MHVWKRWRGTAGLDCAWEVRDGAGGTLGGSGKCRGVLGAVWCAFVHAVLWLCTRGVCTHPWELKPDPECSAEQGSSVDLPCRCCQSLLTVLWKMLSRPWDLGGPPPPLLCTPRLGAPGPPVPHPTVMCFCASLLPTSLSCGSWLGPPHPHCWPLCGPHPHLCASGLGGVPGRDGA